MKLTRFLVAGSLLASLVATPVLASEGRMEDEVKDKMMERKENAQGMGTCLREANKTFRDAREGKWQARKDAVSAASEKFEAARKSANSTFEAAVKKARESKDETALKAAKEARRTELNTAREAFKAARKAAVGSWHDAWETAHDAFKASQEKCRQN